MVDFSSEGVFTANKAHILELVILGRRDELINTFQLWSEAKISNSSKEEQLRNKLRAVLLSIFLELERPLSRKLKADAFKDLKKNLITFNLEITAEDLMNIYFVINTALDELNLIKIDNKRAYDSTSIETENEQKGL